MRTITIEINDVNAKNFDDFAPEMKKKVCSEVAELINKMNYDARVEKLKKLVDEINTTPYGMSINPDIILDLLDVEDE